MAILLRSLLWSPVPGRIRTILLATVSLRRRTVLIILYLLLLTGRLAALLRASEASGEVNDMLVRLADSTRQNVASFEDAMTSQLNARSSVAWGTYGPWMIFCVFRLITLLIAFAGGGGLVCACGGWIDPAALRGRRRGGGADGALPGLVYRFA